MRFVSLALAVGLAATGCGLDAGGLASDEGGISAPEDGALGTVSDSGVVRDGATGTTDATMGAGDSSVGSDATIGPDTGEGTGSSDGGTDDTGNGNVGSNDSGPGLDDGCGSTEICNNGVDDNCDGKIDCEDPQCSPAWTCTPAAIPASWSLVEYVENARPACAASYSTSSDVLEGPEGAPATCGCGCSITTPGTCETGSAAVFIGDGLCPPTASGTNPANGGACSPVPIDFQAFAGIKAQVNPVGYTAGQCAPVPSETEADAGAAGQGRVCRDTNGTGSGCANGGACAPASQGDGFSICILHNGVQTTCPTGFPNLHVVGASLTDGRGCSTCTCAMAAATCDDATMTFFTDSACGDGGVAVTANGQCNDFPGTGGQGVVGAPTYVAYEYTAQVKGEACVPSPIFADGGVGLTQPRTICCQ